MNNLIIELSELQITVNIIIRIITAVIFLCFIIPLQIKEARVKNGLAVLRLELLVSGIILFFVNTFGLSVIVLRYLFGDSVVQKVTEFITIFNSIGFLFIACIKFHIYHREYTPENKQIHATMERLKENKK